MKRKMNESTIKSAAIGLSAIMAVSTPMTALAAEGENNNKQGNEDPVIQNEKTTIENLQNEASNLVADEKKDENGKGTEQAGAVKNAENKENAAVHSGEQSNNANIEAAAANLKKESTDSEGKNKTTENINQTQQDLQDVEKKEDIFNDKNEELKNTETSITDAKNDLTALDQNINQNKANIESGIDDINNAKDIHAADQSLQTVQNDVTKTKEDANNKLKEIGDQLQDAQNKYDSASKALEELNQKIEEASKHAGEAATNLGLAKGQALALQSAAKNEIEALGKQKKEILDIVKNQNSQENAEKFNWWMGDQQFKNIMKNYYIPEVMNKKETDGSSYELDADFTRSKNSAYADENYIKVFKKDKDGKVVDTLYYNYHLDKDNKGKIVIFEKTPGERTKNVTVNRTNDHYDKYLQDQKNHSADHADFYFLQASDKKFEAFLNKEENKEIREQVETARENAYRGGWKEDDILFNLVMKNYYVPEVLGWKNANVSGVYQYNAKELKSLNGVGFEGTNGYEGNTAVIEKMDKKGKVIERKFFNYKYDHDLIIFEKTEEKRNKKVSVYLNDNYEKYKKGDSSGILFFEADHKDFNEYIKEAKQSIDYQKVEKDAKAAADAAEIAEKKVNSLKSQIDALKNTHIIPPTELEVLKRQLEAAKKKFQDEKEKVTSLESELNEKLEEAKKAFEEKKKDFTEKHSDNSSPATESHNPSSATDSRNSSPNASNDAEEGTTNTDRPVLFLSTGRPAVNNSLSNSAVSTTTPAAAPLLDINIGGLDGEQGDEPVVIEDEDTPLAASPKKEKMDQVEEAVIADADVPKAASEKMHVSWLWALIIAILGTSGFVFYQKIKAKKDLNNKNK